jgi:hypothetical protein
MRGGEHMGKILLHTLKEKWFGYLLIACHGASSLLIFDVQMSPFNDKPIQFCFATGLDNFKTQSNL